MNLEEKDKLLSDFARELSPVKVGIDSEEGKPARLIVTDLLGTPGPNYPSTAELYKEYRMKPCVDRYWRTNATGVYAIFLALKN